MSVQRFRRKPVQEYREDQFAARYEPGQSLDALRAVAAMAGDEAEIREVVFPSGKRVLIAWFMRCDDPRGFRPDYAMVEPGEYLAYSSENESLYESDEANWTQFYDLVTGDG